MATMKLKLADSVEFGTNILEVEVPDEMRRRVKTNINYFDGVLGGEGLTPGSVYLFTGEPGSGKSTLMHLVADALTGTGHGAVFVSGEESPFQLKMVAERLRLKNGYMVSQDTHVPTLLKKVLPLVAKLKAEGKTPVLLVDSLQTLDDGHYKDGFTNGQTPLKALALITEFCKEHYCTAIVVGQVNKSGQFAGNNKLKHMVDGHLHLAIEVKDKELEGTRKLSCLKNRFGSNGTEFYLALKKRGFDVVAETRFS
jgi:DNA repair protein RadA/Sms